MTVYNLQQFQYKLKIRDYAFSLSENLVSSQSYSGAMTVNQLGPRIWQGSLTCSPTSFDVAREIETVIRNIQTAGNYFAFCPPKYEFPQADPTGSKLGSATVTITSPVAGYTVNLSGLPSNYKITAGDYFSVLQNGVSVIYQFAETKTAAFNGTISIKMLNPFRANFIPANGASAYLTYPWMTCRYQPGSMKTGTIGLDSASGYQFDFQQVFSTQ